MEFISQLVIVTNLLAILYGIYREYNKTRGEQYSMSRRDLENDYTRVKAERDDLQKKYDALCEDYKTTKNTLDEVLARIKYISEK